MKRYGLLFTLCLVSCALAAQETKGSLSGFMKEELTDFDQFISKENQAFINFLREPWKQLDAQKPVVKRKKPEPVRPVVYDSVRSPKRKTPVQLPIEEIIDLTTEEGKQRPVVRVTDVDDITFEDEPVIVQKQGDKPVVVVRETRKEETPEEETPEQESPEQAEKKKEKRPVVIVKEVTKETPRKEDTKRPVVIVKETPKQEKPKQEKPKQEKPKPEAPKQDPSKQSGTPITFAGQTFRISNALNRVCRLRSLDENSIADAYEALCRANYKPLLTDCARIRQSLSLNDWGYFQLLRQAANTLCAGANESTVLQLFLLNESGYRTKIARKSDEQKLLLFLSPDCKLYGRPYLTLGGQTYYYIDGTEPCRFYMCQRDFSRSANPVSMALRKAPAFKGSAVTHTHKAQGSAASVNAPVPESLMEFYRSYPQCDYSVYFNAPVNPGVEAALLSALQPLIQGKSEAQAANLLINFVQTAFDYKTDPDQFGYEKPFFVEELFYYPFSDCEDRSMLYSYLVRKLLGLDVVLLDYPEHIATAVAFKGNVDGDYVLVGNRKYIVCDPTYIGAPIGQAMPQYRTVKAGIIKN
ncbi:MAG: hypothetical protein LBL97_00940 [Prevotellaceae bacterium]|jgi:hypothetical protein|nr:hypothetical protein [Prevotellaceae bacterium]